ncbi:hypothetical protein GCM10009841_08620 [Microlunatus panaciterrae]|uniref:Uncharacterized protein n=1 Tax=Microlunatus panaciterrae TaxID=400768 RepID=A0ABS2RK66_9ACTN|nr:hypothetical protein [Microlunatus panaciterrae]MBM7799408.1 hypothetical protein [Microlunatus panaciterrae]
MTTQTGPVKIPVKVGPSRARRDLIIAWVSVALIPVAFAAAMLVGDGLLTLQGYESGSEQTPPLLPVLLAAVPAMLVLLTPTVTAVWFGLRARREGRQVGLVPALIGMVAGAGAILLNLAAYLVGRFTE